MRNIKKHAFKILFLTALFAPAAFADGEMGGGGLADTGDGSRNSKAIVIQAENDGEMGGGGLTANIVLIAIRDYLKSIV
jgi:hypothetical protein